MGLEDVRDMLPRQRHPQMDAKVVTEGPEAPIPGLPLVQHGLDMSHRGSVARCGHSCALPCLLDLRALAAEPVLQRRERDLHGLRERRQLDLRVGISQLEHEQPVALAVGPALRRSCHAAWVVHQECHDPGCDGLKIVDRDGRVTSWTPGRPEQTWQTGFDGATGGVRRASRGIEGRDHLAPGWGIEPVPAEMWKGREQETGDLSKGRG